MFFWKINFENNIDHTGSQKDLEIVNKTPKIILTTKFILSPTK